MRYLPPAPACLLETPVFILSMPSGCGLGVGLSSESDDRKGRCRGAWGRWRGGFALPVPLAERVTLEFSRKSLAPE